MRAAVIRGDLPSALLMTDLETVSSRNASTVAKGQVRYLSRPTTTELETALASSTTGAGATVAGSTLTFNITVTASTTDDLRLRTSSTASFTVYTIAAAVYTSLTSLLTAVNAALAGSGITARANVAEDGISLESGTWGVDSYLELDTVANGSNGNTNLGLPDGEVRTVPSAATIITAVAPVGGPLDVSTSTINGVGSGTSANALTRIPSSRGAVGAIAEAVAPLFTETPLLEDSMRNGVLSGFLSATFNPDSRRGLPNGAAIAVVQDDGSTAYTVGSPTITSATLDSPSSGDVTIAGTSLASVGDPTGERKESSIRFTGVGTPQNDDLIFSQALIEANGGTVTATSIVIPAVLNASGGFATTTTSVQVRYRTYASALEALA